MTAQGFGRRQTVDGMQSHMRPTIYRLILQGTWLVICLGLTNAGRGQTPADVIGMHDLSPGSASPIQGTLSGACLYCHAPLSGLNGAAGVAQTPLWDQKLFNVQSYTLYTSGTMTNTANGALTLGTNSTLCLSCHDGTVAGSPGALVPYGNVPTSGNWIAGDVLGTDLSAMHPINLNLPIQAASDLVSSLSAFPPSTADSTGAVKLINGNVECGSCHNPHVQNIDPGGYFLVINNTKGALCLACHTNVPTASGMGLVEPMVAGRTAMRVMRGPLAGRSNVNKINPLAGWSTSIHATATNKVPSHITVEANSTTARGGATSQTRTTLGNYGTVARNACSSCHAQHNARGGHSLLRAADDQACLVCHNGSSNTSPPIANVLAETLAPKYGHAFSPANSPHAPTEAALLDQNRHVTCADCHNPHSSSRVPAFPAAPVIRPSQGRVMGISATDGKTILNPASNQYENCLRCHGTSTGKQLKIIYAYLPVWEVASTDPLDVIPQFSTFATSSHPVFHDRMSPLPQPSLRGYMLNLDGITAGRTMGARILCTDCHNSDDNREFGGSGPSGPHGSIFPHILERRYEFSQAGSPGTTVTNLFPSPNLSAQGGPSGGPYALCAKCHDLSQILKNTSFGEHARHIEKDGFPCSVCHTGHGMGVQSANVSGERLVNFDLKVVAPNGSVPISYNRVSNSCSLVCHNHAHQLRSASGIAKH